MHQGPNRLTCIMQTVFSKAFLWGGNCHFEKSEYRKQRKFSKAEPKCNYIPKPWDDPDWQMTIMLHTQAKTISTFFDLLSITQEDAKKGMNRWMSKGANVDKSIVSFFQLWLLVPQDMNDIFRFINYQPQRGKLITCIANAHKWGKGLAGWIWKNIFWTLSRETWTISFITIKLIVRHHLRCIGGLQYTNMFICTLV